MSKNSDVAGVKKMLAASKDTDEVFAILPNGQPTRISYVERNPRTGAVYLFTDAFVSKTEKEYHDGQRGKELPEVSS